MLTLTAAAPAPLSRTTASDRDPLRVALVQHRWRDDAAELARVLRGGIDRAAGEGARVVFLPEITLLRYPADVQAGPNPGDAAEELTEGPTFALAAEAARANGIFVHASLYEKSPAADGLGYNTAILVSPSGELVGRTRKMHIPISAGYYEDTYFRAGPAENAYPVYEPEGLGARLACRPVGTSGSPRWPAATPSVVPRSSSTRRPSDPSRCSRPSTPSRCGSR